MASNDGDHQIVIPKEGTNWETITFPQPERRNYNRLQIGTGGSDPQAVSDASFVKLIERAIQPIIDAGCTFQVLQLRESTLDDWSALANWFKQQMTQNKIVGFSLLLCTLTERASAILKSLLLLPNTTATNNNNQPASSSIDNINGGGIQSFHFCLNKGSHTWLEGLEQNTSIRILDAICDQNVMEFPLTMFRFIHNNPNLQDLRCSLQREQIIPHNVKNLKEFGRLPFRQSRARLESVEFIFQVMEPDDDKEKERMTQRKCPSYLCEAMVNILRQLENLKTLKLIYGGIVARSADFFSQNVLAAITSSSLTHLTIKGLPFFPKTISKFMKKKDNRACLKELVIGNYDTDESGRMVEELLQRIDLTLLDHFEARDFSESAWLTLATQQFARNKGPKHLKIDSWILGRYRIMGKVCSSLRGNDKIQRLDVIEWSPKQYIPLISQLPNLTIWNMESDVSSEPDHLLTHLLKRDFKPQVCLTCHRQPDVPLPLPQCVEHAYQCKRLMSNHDEPDGIWAHVMGRITPHGRQNAFAALNLLAHAVREVAPGLIQAHNKKRMKKNKNSIDHNDAVQERIPSVAHSSTCPACNKKWKWRGVLDETGDAFMCVLKL